MNIKYFFSLFALSQGCLVIGFILFVLWYYLPKDKKQVKDLLHWDIVVASVSYIFLIAATIRTAVFGLYDVSDPWYWMITISYIGSDVSFIFLFRKAVKRRRIESLKKPK